MSAHAAGVPPFAVTTDAMAVLDRLWTAGHAAYLVGGGVRDALLSLPVSDWDVATDARPERILRLFPGSTYQNRFGTVLARGLEITTFRRDHRYADHRRPDNVTFSDDIYEDLARRDLTINAIAWGRRSLEDRPRLVDPADGQRDLAERLVRAVGDPGQRFEEDALRLLRTVRIAARLGFTIEPVTRRAMVEHAGDIEWVSEERIGSELGRMLEAESPSRAIRLMHETAILSTTLPDLAALPSDRLDRAMRTLDRVAATEPDNERLRLAALFSEVDPGASRRALERLRVAGRRAEEVAALLAGARVPYDPAWHDAEVRRYMGSLAPELLEDLLALRAARAGDDEAAVEAGLRERIGQQRADGAALRLGDLAVDGRDLRQTLGLPEGPLIGRLLDKLLDDVIEDPRLNSRPTLLTRASLLLEDMGPGNGDGPGRPAIG